jgi:hypothetical protein
MSSEEWIATMNTAPGFVIVGDEKVMRLPGEMLSDTWAGFWEKANALLGTRFADADQQPLSGATLTGFVALAREYAGDMGAGPSRDVMLGLAETCQRYAESQIAVLIQT